ncbi:hypothetical protein BTO06_10825 [Tenacibaculum sp. SZ-18]|uniref:hypothetical protein n=1 Tax=Tenacibaculum sp. SZ-18 TaxID=754423 RepID=UPI000C2D0490|nr:hypothetical protein [Tenacibaculum sp. SZ-18]AUC15608.1 hypothetical protein BTO06_10825 [Tenacibaculum sp. SZ-18]
MKSIKLLLVAVTLVFSNIVAAETNSFDDKAKMAIISREISSLLQNPSFPVERNASVTVKFAVNRNNELVVLSVEAEYNKDIIEEFIKTRLNYRKLSSNIKAQVYTLPVKMVSL